MATLYNPCPCGQTESENKQELELEKHIVEQEREDQKKPTPVKGRPIEEATDEWPDNPCACNFQVCTYKKRYYHGCVRNINPTFDLGGI